MSILCPLSMSFLLLLLALFLPVHRYHWVGHMNNESHPLHTLDQCRPHLWCGYSMKCGTSFYL